MKYEHLIHGMCDREGDEDFVISVPDDKYSDKVFILTKLAEYEWNFDKCDMSLASYVSNYLSTRGITASVVPLVDKRYSYETEEETVHETHEEIISSYKDTLVNISSKSRNKRIVKFKNRLRKMIQKETIRAANCGYVTASIDIKRIHDNIFRAKYFTYNEIADICSEITSDMGIDSQFSRAASRMDFKW